MSTPEQKRFRIFGWEITRQRAGLLASLGFNFIAKLPGILAVFIILPAVSRSLGTEGYGQFLAALALGSLFTLPYGGVGAVGRRLLAGAHGDGNKKEESDVFVTTMSFSFAMTLVLLAAVTGVAYFSWPPSLLYVVCCLPILSSLFNTFDNMRSSYNEHYVTANFQLFFQLAIYGTVFLAGLPHASVLFSGMALQGPFMLASIATGIALVVKRPYLLSGAPRHVRLIIAPAVGVMMADGAIAGLLNFSVYWLGRVGDPQFAAWYGTFLRLFQSFMSPVMLILFPLTSYISIHWGKLSQQRQKSLHKLFILGGFSYGILVAFCMAVGGSYYIGHMFSMKVHGDTTDLLCIVLFLGAVVAQKSYTLLIYSIDEGRSVSYGTAAVAAIGLALAALSSIWVTPPKVVDTLFLSTGILLPLLLIRESIRQRQRYA